MEFFPKFLFVGTLKYSKNTSSFIADRNTWCGCFKKNRFRETAEKVGWEKREIDINYNQSQSVNLFAETAGCQ